MGTNNPNNTSNSWVVSVFVPIVVAIIGSLGVIYASINSSASGENKGRQAAIAELQPTIDALMGSNSTTLATEDNPFVLSSSIYPFYGLEDPQFGGGIGRLFVNQSNNDIDYKFEYNIPDQGDGYAGFVLHFSPPIDMTQYEYIEITLIRDDPSANCDVYLKKGDNANYIRICDGSFINGARIERITNTEGDTIRIPLRLNFTDVDQTSVEEIGFSANAEFTRGIHSFTIREVRFIK